MASVSPDDLLLPHSIGDCAIAVQSHHLVFVRDVMQERVFVVGEECVWHPDLLGEVARQSHEARVVVGEGESLVSPVLVQVDRDRVVLCTQAGSGINKLRCTQCNSP